MARRNLFQPPPPPSSSDTASASEPKPRFPATGAMSGVKSTLKDLSSNAVKDIAVDLIEEGGPKDRLAFSDAEVASLAASLKEHGQQVPIMVRPLADQPGRYRVVYGRRRLRALQSIGMPAKALVRSLTDEEAILAQGQENSHRLDPSFIEKALFVAELSDGGYEQPVILDALAIDKPMLSRMTKVARAIPRPVIQMIGSAHGVGRRRWEDLADKVRDSNVDLDAIISALSLDSVPSSDDRFARVSDAVAQNGKAAKVAAPAAQIVRSDDGTALAEIKDSPRALTLKMSKTDAPEFTQWMRDNADFELKRLYEAWKSGQQSD
ncbi:plasmid partitioning protein RepB (plasmid) [Marinovum sp. KMM 9989]